MTLAQTVATLVQRVPAAGVGLRAESGDQDHRRREEPTGRAGPRPRARSRRGRGIRVGDSAHVDRIKVKGDVAGRDIVHCARADFDVSNLSNNPIAGWPRSPMRRAPSTADATSRLRELWEPAAEGDERPLVFVTGASGSGKSSLCRRGWCQRSRVSMEIDCAGRYAAGAPSDAGDQPGAGWARSRARRKGEQWPAQR
jgi:hypothetical protein